MPSALQVILLKIWQRLLLHKNKKIDIVALTQTFTATLDLHCRLNSNPNPISKSNFNDDLKEKVNEHSLFALISLGRNHTIKFFCTIFFHQYYLSYHTRMQFFLLSFLLDGSVWVFQQTNCESYHTYFLCKSIYSGVKEFLGNLLWQ